MSRPRIWHSTTKLCELCKKEFEAKTRYAITTQRFCGLECRSAVTGKLIRKKRTKRRCRLCKKKMRVLPCHKETKFYCSWHCRIKWQKEHGIQAGANNAAWKGGIGNRGAYWKRQARERDDHKCQFPGCTSNRMVHAHHKIPRSVGGTDDLSNLVTLCNKHHMHVEREILKTLINKHPNSTRNSIKKIYAFQQTKES